MHYKIKARKNRFKHFFVKERSVRFSLFSFLVTLMWGFGLSLWSIREDDWLAIGLVVYLFPISAAVTEIVQSSWQPSVQITRLLSFMMIVIVTLATTLDMITAAPPSVLFMNMFFADVLAIASVCVRQRIIDDVNMLKKDRAKVWLYLVCVERVAVWLITCVVLVIIAFMLDVGGIVKWLHGVCVLIFCAAFIAHARKTLCRLRGS